jgi:hypothetical protein
VQKLDPVYSVIEGYSNEWQDSANGCSFWQTAQDGLEGVLGVAGTAGIAVGGAGAVGSLARLGTGDALTQGASKADALTRAPTSAAKAAADVLQDPAALEGLTPSQIDELARNAGYEVLPGKAGAANPATRYYRPGTNKSVGFRVLPGGVEGQAGVKGGAYLKFFGGDLGGQRITLGSP